MNDKYNIEELKSLDEQLREAEKKAYHAELKFQRLVENIKDIVYSVDYNGKVTYVNKAFIDLFGYTKDEIIGKHFTALVGEKSLPKLKELFHKQLNNEDIGVFETIIIDKNGDKHIIEATESLDWRDGKIVRANGIGRDITEKRNTEKEIKYIQEQHKLVVDNLNEGLWLIDQNNNTTFVNDKLLEMFGYTRNEMIGKNLLFFMEGKYFDIAKMNVERRKNGISETHEFKFKKKNGDILWVELTTSPIFDGATYKGAIAGLTNITEKKQIQSAFKKSELQYRRLFETAKDGILILNATTKKIIDVNPFLIDLLGYPYDYFIGKELWEIGIFADIELSKKAYEELEKTGYIRYEDLPLQVKTGEKKEVEFVSNVYLLGDEKVIQCNIRDITGRKLAEKNVKQSEKKFREIFETARNSMFISKIDGTILDINKAAVDTFGYTLDEVREQKITMVDLYENPNNRPLFIAKLIEKGFIEDYEIRMKKRNGETIDIEVTVVLRRDEFRNPVELLGTVKDITEKKKQDFIIKQSEEKFRNVFETSQDVMFFSSVDGKFTDINKAGESLFGYTIEEFKNIDLAKDLYVHNGLGRGGFIKAVEETGWIKNHEVTFKRKDGKHIVCIINAAVRRNESGDIIGYQGIIHDITEHKTFEQSLERAAKEWKTTFDSISDPLFVVNTENIIIKANKAFAEKVGLPFNKIIGQTCDTILHCPRFSQPECVLNVVQRNNSCTEEINHSTFYTYTQLSVSPLYDVDDSIIGAIHIIKDITEKKKHELEIKRQHELTKLYLDTANVMIVVLNNKANIKCINKKGASILGYTKEELIGKNWIDTCIPENEKENVKRIFLNLLNENTIQTDPIQNSVILKDGSIKQMLWFNTIIKDDDGNVIGTISSGEAFTNATSIGNRE